MQTFPGGHGIEHEPASAVRVELLEVRGDARMSVSGFFLAFVLMFDEVWKEGWMALTGDCCEQQSACGDFGEHSG